MDTTTAPPMTSKYRQNVFYAIWFSQMLSIVGSGLTGFALRVWAFEETQSVTQFALITFFYGLPAILLSPFAGAMVDRFDRKWVMLLSDLGAGIGTATIWLLVRADALEVWHIYIVVAFLSVFSALQGPAYTASIPLLVSKDMISRANGMNQLGPALSRIIAPLVAGVLVVTLGIGGVTEIDLATFMIAWIVLFFIRIPRPPDDAAPSKEKPSFSEELKAGWHYVRQHKGFVALLAIFAVLNFTQGMIVVLIAPLVLSFSNASTLGVVFAVSGVGAVIGALTMSVWKGPKSKLRGGLGFSLLRSLLLFLGGLQPAIWLIAVASSLYLFFSQLMGASLQTIWQVKVPPKLQGRVFALRNMVALSFLPLGQILSGPLADNVFQPLMDKDGALANSVGRLIGVGPGRGVGLMLIVMGIINFTFTVGAYLYRPIRLIEEEIPDAILEDTNMTTTMDRKDGVKNPAVTPAKKKTGRVWLKRIGWGLLGLLLVVIIAGIWFVRRPFPETSGTLNVPGLQAQSRIVRDEWGIPHIYAENNHDLFFTQGYAQAQDRLWQMDFYRRVATGRLSEVLGERAIEGDKFYRNMLLRATAEQIYADMNPEEKEYIDAFAAGVNAYIDSHENKLPLEYTIFGLPAVEWTPVDTLSWGNLMTMHLGGNRRLEIVRAQMAAAAGEEAMQELLPSSYGGKEVMIPDGVNGYAGYENFDLSVFADYDSLIGAPFMGLGSSSWIAGGSNTETGMPILANDVHMGHSLPSLWYDVGLHGGDFNVVGFTMIGIPAVLTGHNDHITWGMTNLAPDSQDYYIERLDSEENPTQYEYNGEWLDLEVRTETINVKGADPVEFEFYLTGHGPVMFDTLNNDDFEPIALRWTLHDGNPLFRSIIALNKATNWDEFRAAMEQWLSPGQSMTYADVDGNFGFQTSGLIPIRAEGHQGLVPVPGWTDEYEWVDTIPFDEMPNELNPDSGFVSTANSRVGGDNYPYYISDSYLPGYRVARISELMNELAPISVEDMHVMQNDTYVPTAAVMLPYLLDLEPQNDRQAEAMEYLRDWDHYEEIEPVGASIYEAWHLNLITNIVKDDLGDGAAALYIRGEYIRHSAQHMTFLERILPDNENHWFDDVTTDAVETRDDIMLQSLEDGMAWLEEGYGTNMANWTWGEVHQADFVSQPVGQLNNPIVKWLFNSGGMPARGGNFAIHSNTFNNDRPFDTWIIPIATHIEDTSDWNNSRWIGSTGQNGNLFHPNRGDLLEMWAAGENHEMFFDQAIIEERAESTLILEP